MNFAFGKCLRSSFTRPVFAGFFSSGVRRRKQVIFLRKSL